MNRNNDTPSSGGEVYLPELDLGNMPHVVTSWFASEGQRVVAGDRLLEVTAGDVTVDISATANGTLSHRCVHLDDRLCAGQLLARITAS
jgi:pyruvate/2-oxoglutarate dehydrogenase complex dihydrolipoamide acyltransferase (E2) component